MQLNSPVQVVLDIPLLGFILLHVIVLFRVLTNFTNDKITNFYIIDCNNVLKTHNNNNSR